MEIRYRTAVWKHPTDGRSLFYRVWEPASSTALLVIVHGFGEHGGRYEPFARALAEHRLSVICPDLWGHGQSEGRRGDIQGLADYLDGLEAVVSHAVQNQTTRSSFAVFGHSFGGLAAIHWALRRPNTFRPLIIQSPLLAVGFPIPRWKEYLVNRLAPRWPTVSVSLGLNPAWLSHDPAIVARYRRDPLVHRTATLRGAVALQDAMRQARERAAQVTIPTLFLYGTEDRVVSIDVCRTFAEQLTCEKRVIGFPGCYHELHHEVVRPTLIEEVVHWIQTHA